MKKKLLIIFIGFLISTLLIGCKDKYKLTLTSTTGGDVSSSAIKNYKHGTRVDVSALPDDGYTFIAWYIDDELYNPEASFSFYIIEDCTFHAKFVKTDELVFHQLTLNSSPGGTVEGNGSFRIYEKTDIKASPNDDYEFVGWYKDNRKISELATYTFYMPDNHLVLEARFELINLEENKAFVEVMKGLKFLQDYNSSYTIKRNYTSYVSGEPINSEGILSSDPSNNLYYYARTNGANDFLISQGVQKDSQNNSVYFAGAGYYYTSDKHVSSGNNYDLRKNIAYDYLDNLILGYYSSANRMSAEYQKTLASFLKNMVNKKFTSTVSFDAYKEDSRYILDIKVSQLEEEVFSFTISAQDGKIVGFTHKDKSINIESEIYYSYDKFGHSTYLDMNYIITEGIKIVDLSYQIYILAVHNINNTNYVTFAYEVKTSSFSGNKVANLLTLFNEGNKEGLIANNLYYDVELKDPVISLSDIPKCPITLYTKAETAKGKSQVWELYFIEDKDHYYFSSTTYNNGCASGDIYDITRGTEGHKVFSDINLTKEITRNFQVQSGITVVYILEFVD